ncbi:MAG: hypothetical protein CMO55_25450 [Verrucomicrobiales bacterium]|nr:hypothetical protein [Verrucomicrobiales bacterium]
MSENNSAGEVILREWKDDQVWFRDLIPEEYPWGNEEFLDEVPETARGEFGVKFAGDSTVDGTRYQSGQIAVVDTREEFVRLFSRSENILGIIVPWFDRIVPATLLTPYQRQIDKAEFRRGLAAKFQKALLITVVLLGIGFWMKEFLMLALLGATIYGLFPLVEVAMTWFRKIDEVSVPELNRRLVNHEFFQRWMLSRPKRSMQIAIGVLVLVFLGQCAVDGGLFNLGQSVQAAALVKKDVTEGGEWWRTVTTGLMHANLIHILFNGMALYSLGRVITAVVSRSLLSVVFLVTVITGSIASLYLGPSEVTFEGVTMPRASVGASGGILGCLGFLLVITYKYKGVIPGYLRLSLIQSAIVVTIFGLLGSLFIDNAAHAGGFVGGVVLGLVFYPWLNLAPERTRLSIRFLGWVSMAVLVAGVVKIAIELVPLGSPYFQ